MSCSCSLLDTCRATSHFLLLLSLQLSFLVAVGRVAAAYCPFATIGEGSVRQEAARWKLSCSIDHLQHLPPSLLLLPRTAAAPDLLYVRVELPEFRLREIELQNRLCVMRAFSWRRGNWRAPAPRGRETGGCGARRGEGGLQPGPQVDGLCGC